MMLGESAIYYQLFGRGFKEDKQLGDQMKMYILIKEDVPKNLTPVIAAHASLICYKKLNKYHINN